MYMNMYNNVQHNYPLNVDDSYSIVDNGLTNEDQLDYARRAFTNRAGLVYVDRSILQTILYKSNEEVACILAVNRFKYDVFNAFLSPCQAILSAINYFMTSKRFLVNVPREAVLAMIKPSASVFE